MWLYQMFSLTKCDGPSLLWFMGFAVLTFCRRLVGGVGEVGGAGRVVSADWGTHVKAQLWHKATALPPPFSKRFLSPCIPLGVLLWLWQLTPNLLTFVPHLIIFVSVYLWYKLILLFLYSVCGFPLFVTILSQVVTGYTEFVE
jgi:hypothetical protein